MRILPVSLIAPLVLLASCALCGCSEAPSQNGVLIAPMSSQLTLLASIQGTIDVTPSGCLGIRLDLDPEHVQVAMFPHGSSFDAEREVVTVPGLGPLGPGDRVDSAGGTIPAESMGSLPIPDDCISDDYVLIQVLER